MYAFTLAGERSELMDLGVLKGHLKSWSHYHQDFAKTCTDVFWSTEIVTFSNAVNYYFLLFFNLYEAKGWILAPEFVHACFKRHPWNFMQYTANICSAVFCLRLHAEHICINKDSNIC